MQFNNLDINPEVLEAASKLCVKRARGARLRANHEFVWWSDMISLLNFVVTTKVATAAVDKYGRVYINPTWWETLTAEQRAGVVAHEALHLIMKHGERIRAMGIDPSLGNIFADLEINDEPRLCELLDGSGGLLPARRLNGEKYYDMTDSLGMEFPVGKTLEWYYGEYRKNQTEQEDEDKSGPEGEPSNEKSDDASGSDTPQDESNAVDGESSGDGAGESDGNEYSDSDESSQKTSSDSDGNPNRNRQVANGDCGSGADGKPRDYELPPPGESGVGYEEEQMEVVRQQIAIRAKSLTEKERGNAPAGMLIFLEQLITPPKINWRRTFQSMFRNCDTWARGLFDTAYSERSRREIPGVLLPGDVEPVPNISMVFDTSGSMAASELQYAASEAQGIMRIVDAAAKIRYVCCDSKAYGVSPIKRISDIKVEGGGGTDMCVGINAVLEEKPRPNIIVIFTDGYTGWPDKAPRNTRLICCLVGDRVHDSAPDWLKTVRVED